LSLPFGMSNPEPSRPWTSQCAVQSAGSAEGIIKQGSVFLALTAGNFLTNGAYFRVSCVVCVEVYVMMMMIIIIMKYVLCGSKRKHK